MRGRRLGLVLTLGAGDVTRVGPGVRALLMEAEWQGGVLDEASGSLPTNISSGGLGFFAVCAVLSDTLVAQ